MVVAALIIMAIGLACGILMYIVYAKLPVKVKGIEKTEEIAAILPGANCGACGNPGCFGFAQALTKDSQLIHRVSCGLLAQDAERVERLAKALGVSLDASAMNKRAQVRCGGNSSVIYHYSGIGTCKAVAQLLGGYNKCPYGCLGLGDCVRVCPQGAIAIEPGKNIAVVDWEKCVGCGLCVPECPNNLIELVPGETKVAFRCSYLPLRNIPAREKCDFGCIHCRKCFNACEYGAIEWNKERATPQFITEKCTLCLKCVAACPNKVLARVAREEARVAA